MIKHFIFILLVVATIPSHAFLGKFFKNKENQRLHIEQASSLEQLGEYACSLTAVIEELNTNKKVFYTSSRANHLRPTQNIHEQRDIPSFKLSDQARELYIKSNGVILIGGTALDGVDDQEILFKLQRSNKPELAYEIKCIQCYMIGEEAYKLKTAVETANEDNFIVTNHSFQSIDELAPYDNLSQVSEIIKSLNSYNHRYNHTLNIPYNFHGYAETSPIKFLSNEGMMQISAKVDCRTGREDEPILDEN